MLKIKHVFRVFFGWKNRIEEIILLQKPQNERTAELA